MTKRSTPVAGGLSPSALAQGLALFVLLLLPAVAQGQGTARDYLLRWVVPPEPLASEAGASAP